MHPAPSLAEAPPNSDAAQHGGQPPPTSGDGQNVNHNHVTNGVHESQVLQPEGNQVPARKDTTSSTSTTATATTMTTMASNESTATGYSVEQSPNFTAHPVFSVKDGSDVVSQRRASRRRTGPLSAVQRERAALIRKLGACHDCRRRRVACHPNHHNTTWEDAARKFRSHSPSVQDLAPAGARPLSPAPSLNTKPLLTLEPNEMDIDVSPTQQPGRPPLSDARISRTPLPSGPRMDKAVPPATPVDSARVSEIQEAASRILASSYRSRYSSVSALLLRWQDDDDVNASTAVEELGSVLQQFYNYTFQIKLIPPSSDGLKGSWRWLSREMTNFIDAEDQRDALKIVYYSGYSYLDGDREMMLASSKAVEPAFAIRWSGIQQILEDASSDTLIIMDTAYYPSSKLLRQAGVLELVAASASEDHVKHLDRGAFTRAVTEQLRTRASQLTEQLRTRAGPKHISPLSAAELHARLLSLYPKMIQDRNPEREMVTSFPSPLHLQVSGSTKLPSILLAPLYRAQISDSPDSPSGGFQMTLTFRLTDDAINADSWAECFRWLPEGIRDVRVEGPSRNTFR